MAVLRSRNDRMIAGLWRFRESAGLELDGCPYPLCNRLHTVRCLSRYAGLHHPVDGDA